MLKKFNLKNLRKYKNYRTTCLFKNLSYLYNSHFCISDSGGLQEEAVLLRKKCFIPANKTPHHHYINNKSNELINLRSSKELFRLLKKILNGEVFS